MGKRLPQRSPAPLAMLLTSVLVTICLLLWMVQNAITTCKSDSLVGGNSKRMTLTPLSPSCVGSDSRRGISHSLATPNFSMRRRMMSSRHRKLPFLGIASATLCAIRRPPRASYAKTQKESQDPRSRNSSLGNAPRHRPCHRHHALWGVTSAPFSHCTAPWRSSSSPTPSSSFPTPQSTSSPPDTWLPVPNHHFQAHKKTPPCGRVFSFSGC